MDKRLIGKFDNVPGQMNLFENSDSIKISVVKEAIADLEKAHSLKVWAVHPERVTGFHQALRELSELLEL